ncbi:hypothetical protein TBLA_0G01860 [Henningerozyma blattae CBS 6284]|uniref:CWH43-like N-terminal domain-containing protein n=1 Tax=Henningerozyma blattae (strain ATCC 34711 / CBS 6284 / DSM 70876 / NBRC 10599 / NRRL Y-10934 / UCD 77-7) TaxID=1071380 RepID=I2H6X7_HENB6|nr:hypothetical protein TBLA_0G01860 [Tetrapisispora blattae CBS 6284]CCH62129.1 hypothetical protein TBLA_0G01860 [Tetrapisispora blattae CBS 6284]
MAFNIPAPANYYFLVPIISFLPWYIMLITMLGVWTYQGRPRYWFMDHPQSIVFISDIGAANLHPLFIVCSFWQGAGYCITVACEYYQRSGHWPFQRKKLLKKLTGDDSPIVDRDHPITHPNAQPVRRHLSVHNDIFSDSNNTNSNLHLNPNNNLSDLEIYSANSNNLSINDDLENPFDDDASERDDEQVPTSDQPIGTIKNNYTHALLSSKFLMPPWYTRDERNLIWAAWVLGLIGELCLFMCSIFSTVKFHRAHITMVYFFLFFMYFSIVCTIAEYFVMGRHYALIHPLADLPPHIHINSIPWYRWEGYIWNKFTISAILKTIWLVVAILCSICFGAIPNDSIKAGFEWCLGFWLGVFFMIVSVDFYLGGRYKTSRYFHQIQSQSFAGYYKYDKAAGVENNHKKGRSSLLMVATRSDLDDQSSFEVESTFNAPIAMTPEP